MLDELTFVGFDVTVILVYRCVLLLAHIIFVHVVVIVMMHVVSLDVEVATRLSVVSQQQRIDAKIPVKFLQVVRVILFSAALGDLLPFPEFMISHVLDHAVYLLAADKLDFVDHFQILFSIQILKLLFFNFDSRGFHAPTSDLLPGTFQQLRLLYCLNAESPKMEQPVPMSSAT